MRHAIFCLVFSLGVAACETVPASDGKPGTICQARSVTSIAHLPFDLKTRAPVGRTGRRSSPRLRSRMHSNAWRSYKRCQTGSTIKC